MSSTNEKILVPIGFTDQSILALQQAVIIADQTNADLVLFSVVEIPSSFKKLFSDFEDRQKEFKQKAKQNLQELANQYCQAFKSVECMVVVGKIYEKIVETSDMLGVSLIVMGTDGSPKELTKKFIGSNAYNVVRFASCPVITVKGKKIKSQFNTIALPLDLHKETKEKVSYALKFARLFNSSIRVFSVTQKNSDSSVKNKLIRDLQQANNFINSKGVECSTEFVEVDSSTSFSSSIINYTNKIEADFLMIMTKEESNLEANFLGSNARKVINKSEIPVVCIQPSPKKDLTTYLV